MPRRGSSTRTSPLRFRSFSGTPSGSDAAALGGWIIVHHPDVHLVLRKRVLVPDLAGWKKENAPDFSTDEVSTATTPDWVCEILSPTTRRHDLVRKRRLYAEHGVPWLWLIDPDAGVLETYRRDAGGYLLLGAHDVDEGPIRAPPFDAIELDLKLVWPPEK
jgi:Uma2 family endonuclease